MKNAKRNGQLKWKKLDDRPDMIEWNGDGDEREFAEYRGFTESTKPGYSGTHKFLTFDGEEVSAWGNKMLNDGLRGYPLGRPVKIVFQGKARSSAGQTYNRFVVYGVEEESV